MRGRKRIKTAGDKFWERELATKRKGLLNREEPKHEDEDSEGKKEDGEASIVSDDGGDRSGT